MMRFFSLLSLSCACISASAAAQAGSPNSPGIYSVGLQVIRQYDYTRSSRPVIDLDTGKTRNGELARPIQTLVWYPAKSGGKPVTYGDYLRAAATQDDFTLSEEQVKQAMQAMLERNGKDLSDARRQAQAAKLMWARREAVPIAGKFPLVIYAPGANGMAHENADLCEYLASQGYVVMASASIGGRGGAMEATAEGAETQAADIAFLIGYAHGLPTVDMGRIAVAGFSWGGLANVLAAAKDQRIRALVSLDGAMRGYPELINGGKDAIKYVTPARVDVPLLYLSAAPKTIEQMEGKYDLSFSFINAMKYSDVYYFILHPMVHANFNLDALSLSGDGEFTEFSRMEVMLARGWASRYVLEFLNAYLKDDKKSRTFLDTAPVGNGVPRHMITADIRPSRSSAPTLEAFSVLLHTKGFVQAIPLYQESKQAGSPLVASEQELNSWGYRLLRSARYRDGLEVIKLMAEMYPDSANAHDSLGEAYAINKDTANAILHYRRSLSLNPKNTGAAQALEKLEHVSPAAH